MQQISFRLSVLLISCLSAFAGVAQKTDKVFLKNGDVITGEVKNMKLAKLSFDMNGPGIISIKWEEVVRLTSVKTFQVAMQNGDIFITKLDSLFFKTKNLKPDDIVEILQIRNRFLKRLEGDVNLGFSYTKSSDIFQLNFSSSITYRQPKIELNLKLNSVNSQAKNDTSLSQKQDATLSYLKALDHRYYLMGNLGWESNTELGLTNRFLLGGGAGKIIFNDNHKRLLTGLGLSYNKEQFDENSNYKGNLEGMAVIQFKRFRYTSPKVNIDAQYTIYPGFTDWGRIRMNLQINTSLEIFKDFLVGFTFYDNFDNRPSKEAASKNDYGITFTIGYKFGK
jgi:putative salt-induced outer membrane protein YdiY